MLEMGLNFLCILIAIINTRKIKYLSMYCIMQSTHPGAFVHNFFQAADIIR